MKLSEASPKGAELIYLGIRQIQNDLSQKSAYNLAKLAGMGVVEAIDRIAPPEHPGDTEIAFGLQELGLIALAYCSAIGGVTDEDLTELARRQVEGYIDGAKRLRNSFDRHVTGRENRETARKAIFDKYLAERAKAVTQEAKPK